MDATNAFFEKLKEAIVSLLDLLKDYILSLFGA